MSLNLWEAYPHTPMRQNAPTYFQIISTSSYSLCPLLHRKGSDYRSQRLQQNPTLPAEFPRPACPSPRTGPLDVSWGERDSASGTFETIFLSKRIKCISFSISSKGNKVIINMRLAGIRKQPIKTWLTHKTVS